MEIRMGSLAVPLDRDGREVPATVETMYEDDGTARKVRYLLVDTNAVRDSADGRYEPTQKCWGVYLEGGGCPFCAQAQGAPPRAARLMGEARVRRDDDPRLVLRRKGARAKFVWPGQCHVPRHRAAREGACRRRWEGRRGARRRVTTARPRGRQGISQENKRKGRAYG